MPELCRQCNREIQGSAITLSYGKEGTLAFCHPRCRRDYVDTLPESSLIRQRLRGER